MSKLQHQNIFSTSGYRKYKTLILNIKTVWNRQPINIQAVLNGARKKIEPPKIPTFSEEILKDAVESIAVDAKEIHFHVRDLNGNETLDTSFIAENLSLLRKNLGNIPLGISTGEWIEPNFEKRKNKLAIG